jgi:hypothetical protein
MNFKTDKVKPSNATRIKVAAERTPTSKMASVI